MKITWTFYPRYEPSVMLTIYYVPELDKKKQYGFLHQSSNTAWVSWEAFKAFDSSDIGLKKEAFGRLTRIEEPMALPDRQ